MIYPTRRAILLMAAGAPVALLIGLLSPGYWAITGAWVALILSLILVDALIGPTRSDSEIEIEAPAAIGVGSRGEARVAATFVQQAPRGAAAALEANDLLDLSPGLVDLRNGNARIEITPLRRGRGQIVGAWLRWPGPMGLVWKQIRRQPACEITVIPNVQAVKDEAVRLFSREALFGIKTQLDTGDGADFHALREMVGAMDTRTIDWKQSARHGKLLGKEFKVERNHPIVFAIDSGRQMCEPLLGLPRIDRALNAALMLAYVSLRLGDRVGLYGFDAAPRLYTGVLAGAYAFDRLRRLSSQLDYSTDETNYTLGLTQLGAALKRRSLVVVFTDFADATSAELMVENVTRLVRRHLVLFVVLRDEELEGVIQREPLSAEDVTRAVTAAGLLKARDVVLERLRRLGVHVVDAPVARLGTALISAYLDLKRRDLM